MKLVAAILAALSIMLVAHGTNDGLVWERDGGSINIIGFEPQIGANVVILSKDGGLIFPTNDDIDAPLGVTTNHNTKRV